MGLGRCFCFFGGGVPREEEGPLQRDVAAAEQPTSTRPIDRSHNEEVQGGVISSSLAPLLLDTPTDATVDAIDLQGIAMESSASRESAIALEQQDILSSLKHQTLPPYATPPMQLQQQQQGQDTPMRPSSKDTPSGSGAEDPRGVNSLRLSYSHDQGHPSGGSQDGDGERGAPHDIIQGGEAGQLAAPCAGEGDGPPRRRRLPGRSLTSVAIGPHPPHRFSFTNKAPLSNNTSEQHSVSPAASRTLSRMGNGSPGPTPSGTLMQRPPSGTLHKLSLPGGSGGVAPSAMTGLERLALTMQISVGGRPLAEAFQKAREAHRTLSHNKHPSLRDSGSISGCVAAATAAAAPFPVSPARGSRSRVSLNLISQTSPRVPVAVSQEVFKRVTGASLQLNAGAGVSSLERMARQLHAVTSGSIDREEGSGRSSKTGPLLTCPSSRKASGAAIGGVLC